jgi:hypothetical protein
MVESGIAHDDVRDVVVAGSREDKTLEVIGLVILAIGTLLTAWSGFQATKWSGVQATNYTRAGAQRAAANNYFTLGALAATETQSDFYFWLYAKRSGNEELANVYFERFADAWEARLRTHPIGDEASAEPPLDADDYEVLTVEQTSDSMESAANLFREGIDANATADSYVLATVFLAMSLFLGGVSTSLDYRPVRMIILVISGLTTLLPGLWVASMPIEF